MSVFVEKRLFTVGEYYRMLEAGILTEDDRVELIEGEIVKMSPLGSGHSGCVDVLNRYFVEGVAGAAHVRIQNPIHLSEKSEPQPDVVLVRPRADSYRSSHPTPTDALLINEVAETSEEFDRAVKLPPYARAGIPEYWMVNLTDELIEIYRQPSEGACRDTSRAIRGGKISPLAFPNLEPAVDAILG